MKLNKIEPEFIVKSNPRIGLITLGSDFRIEKDFNNIVYGKDIDLYVNRIHCYNPLTNESLIKMTNEDILNVNENGILNNSMIIRLIEEKLFENTDNMEYTNFINRKNPDSQNLKITHIWILLSSLFAGIQIRIDNLREHYKNKIDEVYNSTDETGATTMQVESFDYRLSNLCNFSCRMCGDMLSSTWGTENRKHGKGDYENYRIWGRKDIKEKLAKFHDQHVVKEFISAVEEKRITELYWCGGEPLMWKIHWTAMERIKELGYADKVLARYNSNMSRINFYGKNLFDDILAHFPSFQICASIDGTGEVGEYIRTGLKYDEWKENIKYGLKFCDSRHAWKRMQLDLTITLPGLFDLENMYELEKDLKIPLLCKKVFTFAPDTYMSPLFLPRRLLNKIVIKIKDMYKDEKKNVAAYVKTYGDVSVSGFKRVILG